MSEFKDKGKLTEVLLELHKAVYDEDTELAKKVQRYLMVLVHLTGCQKEFADFFGLPEETIRRSCLKAYSDYEAKLI